MSTNLSDWGMIVASDWRDWFRATIPARERPVRSRGEYATVVRDVLRRRGQDVPDLRLLAVGYCCVTPTQMVEMLPAWLAAWERSVAVERPSVVGSCFNSTPEAVWACWRRGWPSVAALAIARYRGIRRTEAVRVGRCLARGLPGYDRSDESRRDLVSTRGACSRRLLAALGRLCPELMRVALETLPAEPLVSIRDGRRHWHPWRIRDVDWARVSEVQARLAADRSGRLRALLAGPRRARQLAGVTENGVNDNTGTPVRDRELAAWFAPAYPTVPLEVARQIAMGRSPRDVAASLGVTLSRAEAHQWCSDGAPDLARWCLPAELRNHAVRDARVSQWVSRQWARPAGRHALTRVRTVRGPGGQEAVIRYVQGLDELSALDLRGSVDETFRAAAERFGEAWLAESRKDHRVICDDRWGVRMPRARLLRTPAQLTAEGDELHHCVGGYAHEVREGRCWILSIRWGEHRSTVELASDASVRQHRGIGNSAPHPACEAVLRSWQRRQARARRYPHPLWVL